MRDGIPLPEYYSEKNFNIEHLYGSTCDTCGLFVKTDEPEWSTMRLVYRTGDPEGLHSGRTLILCEFCSTQSLCSKTLSGIHSEIWTLDDDDDNSGYAWHQWPKSIGVTKKNFGVVGRLGVCSRCGEPMMWDVGLQRWTDLDELEDEYWDSLGNRGGWFVDDNGDPHFTLYPKEREKA